MSKYEKTIDYVDDDKSPLISGEELIWTGRPKKKAFIVNKLVPLLPFVIIWLCFDTFFIITFLGAMEGTQMIWFLIPFFLLHLAPVWIWLGNLVTSNKRWKNTKYYVTDKRIIIKNGVIAENYQTIYYKEIRNVTLHIGIIDKMLGVGDIYFDIYGNMNYPTSRATIGGMGFLDIEDYAELYPKLQKIVLDIQTDIEYPNALRPESNPGYKTKYRP